MEYLELENEIKNSVELLKAYYIQLYRELNKLEDKPMELTQTQQQNEKRTLKYKENLRDLWDNIKQNNICIIGVPE